jgi:hypothetical protein
MENVGDKNSNIYKAAFSKTKSLFTKWATKLAWFQMLVAACQTKKLPFMMTAKDSWDPILIMLFQLVKRVTILLQTQKI